LRNKVINIVRAATFIALIFLAIYFFRVPNGIGGFIHFGDSLIFVGASLLPVPFSLFVAALGPGLFNLAAEGGAIWFPFTIVIKPLMALCFTCRGDSILGPVRNRVAPFVAAVINTVLYFFANMILFDGFTTGLAALPGLAVQGVGSVIVFFVVAVALDKIKIKKMFGS